MTRPIIVSAVQMEVSYNLEDNVNKSLRFLDMTASSDIVCFPELSLTGFTRTSNAAILKELKIIGKKAKEHNTWVLVGGYSTNNMTTYNETYLISATGELWHTYRKIHLWKPLERDVTPGSESHAITTDFGKIGIAVCWDIYFSDTVHNLANEGAEIIFCPMRWQGTDRDYYGLPRADAFRHKVFLVVCDTYAQDTTARSKIISPATVLAEAGRKEQIITKELDLKLLDLHKKYFETIT